MNRKPRRRNQPQPLKAEVPANVGHNHPGKAKSYVTRQWLEEVAAGTEKGLAIPMPGKRRCNGWA